jgi:dsDNA-binding SOS-regulon protein
VYFAGYIVTKVNEEKRREIFATLKLNLNKSKSINDDETREKLKLLLASTKKEIAEILKQRYLNEINLSSF